MNDTLTHRQRIALYASRRKMAVKLHHQKFSLSEIGERLDPPVSRQRVWQMLKKEGVV